MRQTAAHVVLREDDAIRSDQLEHLAVLAGARLCNDILRAQLLEHQRNHHAVLNVGHADDDAVKIAHADGLQHGLIFGICNDGVRHGLRDRLCCTLAAVNRKHLMPERIQLLRNRRAKAAQPDHNK